MSLQVSMHGHGLVLEKQDLGTLTPFGGYARYSSSSGSVNWLHATFSQPIPDAPASLVQVGFRYRMYQPQPGSSAASQQAEITALHLYDGEKRVARYDFLEIHGVDPDNWISRSFDVPETPRIQHALGISIGVKAVSFVIEFSTIDAKFE